MQIDLSYYTVTNGDILSLSNPETLDEFLTWYPDNAPFIRMPWGDYLYSLETYLVETEDFEQQEEFFSNCSLNLQNLIYKLKQLQLKDNPDSKAELVFEN